MEHKNWNGFKGETWKNEINVRDFIQSNYKEYTGDESFLAGATERTKLMMKNVQGLLHLKGSSAVSLRLILQLFLHSQAILPDI